MEKMNHLVITWILLYQTVKMECFCSLQTDKDLKLSQNILAQLFSCYLKL